MKNKTFILSILLTLSLVSSANEKESTKNNKNTVVKPPILASCSPLPQCKQDSTLNFLQWTIDLITQEEKQPTKTDETNKKPGE